MSHAWTAARGARPSRARYALAGALALGLCTTSLGVATLNPAAAADGAGTPPAAQAQGARDFDASAFAKPPEAYKVKYRWWVPAQPLAQADIDRQLDAMKQAGAQGAELAFWTPSTSSSPYEDTYGFGSAGWIENLRKLFTSADQRGMHIDITLGPMWQMPSVPKLDINSAAASKKLVDSIEYVAAGKTRTGALTPTPAAAAFDGVTPQKTREAVLAVRCASSDCATATGARQVESATVIDLTDKVAADGTLTWTAPADGTYVLLNLESVYSGFNADTIFGFLQTKAAKGEAPVPDIYSQAGAKSLQDFWDQTFAATGLSRDLIARVGDNVFIDSPEFPGNVKWTGDMAAQFHSKRGYDITKALPVIATQADGASGTKLSFSTQADKQVLSDYNETMSNLVGKTWLPSMTNWASKWGMTTRFQPYGLSWDISDVVSSAGVPESESLAPEKDLTKIVSMAAYINGNTEVGCECGALQSTAYRTTLAGPAHGTGVPAAQQGILAEVYQQMARGATLMDYHGWSWDGPVASAAWPGWHAWDKRTLGLFMFSEPFGPRNSNWSGHVAANQAVDRLQYALRQGTPDFDVAVYHDRYGRNQIFDNDRNLANSGYAYNYLSAGLLKRDDVKWQQNTLLKGRGDFDAVVIDQVDDYADADSVTKLADFADQGMPVIFVGTTPTKARNYGGDGAAGDARVRQAVDRMLARPNVTTVSSTAALPGALASLGVQPTTANPRSSAPLDVMHRIDGDTGLYFVFNKNQTDFSDTITLKGAGVPFELDQWTGKIRRIPNFKIVDGGVQVPVTIGANDAKLYALSTHALDGTTAATQQLVSTNADSVNVTDKSRVATSFTGGDLTAGFKDGSVWTGKAAAPAAALALDKFSLAVDSWTPGATSTQTTVSTLPAKQVEARADGTLPSWQQIPGLEGVSGIGHYSTTVTLGSDWTPDMGATIDLGSATDSVKVTVNGAELAVPDQSDLSRIDLGSLLHPGTNTIGVDVATTMFQAVRTSGDAQYQGASPAAQPYGLFGPVVVHPYRIVTLTKNRPGGSTGSN